MKKKFLAAAIGAMLVGGSAMAVEVAQGGKGDVLIAPMFMAGGGWTSEIKVINTNPTDSAVAKVVFHAPTNSAELLDFLIFLTPGDVWVGTVQQNADGSVGIISTDDSAVRVTDAAGCPTGTGTTGITANFAAPFTTGYLNVFETRMIRGTVPTPYSKASLVAAYSAACLAGTPITTALTDNVLTGSVKLANPLNGNMLALPMTALANYDNFTYHSVGRYTGFFANVAASNKAMVEDAIWSSDYVIPYNNAAGQYTFATITFPTKEAFYAPSASGSQYTPFPGTPTVGYTVRDEEERSLTTTGCSVSPCPVDSPSTLPAELNIIAITSGAGTSTVGQLFTQTFTKGWVNAAPFSEVSDTRSKTGNNNLGVVGLPGLATYIQWNFVGSTLQGAWNYAPKTFAPGNF